VQASLCENYFIVIYIKKKCIFVPVIQKNMSFINPIPREQLMLPTSIDDYISSDHIIRFVDAFGELARGYSHLTPSALFGLCFNMFL